MSNKGYCRTAPATPGLLKRGQCLNVEQNLLKLDGVGPVDNRPSTNKLHHFVKKNKNKNVTCDT